MLLQRKKHSSLTRTALQQQAFILDFQLEIAHFEKQVKDQQIKSVWDLHIALLSWFDFDVDAAEMMIVTLSVAEATVRELKDDVSATGRYKFEALSIPATIFISEPGVKTFTDGHAEEYDFNDIVLRDERYGWASLFKGELERIDLKGSHMQVFVHEENVVKLARHLLKLVESNCSKKHGD